MDCNTVISQSCPIRKEFTEKVFVDGTDLARINRNDDIDKKSEIIKPAILDFETEVIWFTVLKIFLFHAIGIYGLLRFNYLEQPMTTLWIIGMHLITNLGVSGGAHRLWSHKSYKAKLPMRILLLMCYSASAQQTIYSWVKNHRLHHKYCDTNADPHNTKRGFFFSHVGWIMMKEHPEVIKKSKQHDFSDVLSDPVVIFGDRYVWPLQLFFGFILPTAVPIFLWNETLGRAIMSQVFIRHIITLNSIWSINSIAHAWGTKSYNKNIGPADNEFINCLAVGDGYHNFHHVFPWDYRSSEKGNNKLNYTTYFIDFCAKLGLAYDLKFPSTDLLKKVILNRGDGTHPMLSEVPILESD